MTAPALCQQPAAAPATQPSGPMLAAIQDIQHATTAPQAIAAYGRGYAIDKTNTALHEAYMRRMIQLGQPQIALFPARTLAAQDPNNGMALGVIAYNSAMSGDFSTALNHVVCAAAFTRDNPGILHDAGELVSWYDNAPNVGKVEYTGRCALREIRGSLERRPEYMESYNRIKDAIAQYRANASALDQQISDAEDHVAALRNQALDIDQQMRQAASEITYHQGVASQLQFAINKGVWSPTGPPNNGWPNPYYGYGYSYPYSYLYRYDRGSLEMYQQDLNRHIQQEGVDTQKLAEQHQTLATTGKGVLDELKVKQDELSQLRANRKQAAERLDNAYLWDPPAVDGVIIQASAPLPPPRVTTAPAVTAAAMAQSPEIAAQYRLELAQLMISNGKTDLAVQALQDIVHNYATTSVAPQAQALLGTLTPPAAP